ncbi:glycoside hydrolase family 88 protein [Draconibacterium sp. IB214405]|uniref:glycoside hydrolase family 88 protein n=1 Tax=Draconibacterium sp. IB214405 TaxID=3097352 RepID=UPI002A168A3F|nr:glycoside hydrolase family 88 protein [Draconibacterium sp. IB214405]MDX8339635.1 glycoside hydrolase family 88 protein [Draconibacterium sp. IB214405]
MIKAIFIILIAVLFASCNSSKEKNTTENFYDKLSEQMSILEKKTANPTKVPRTITPDGEYRLVGYTDWTSGFSGGSYWYLYELTGDENWKEKAIENTLKTDSAKYMTSTHDLGFMVYCSYGNAYRTTGENKYRDVIIQASESLITRFDPVTECIRSWDFNKWQYPVIIDNMMNLEMLFFASKETGDPKYKDIAIKHANKTLANHFREDMSSYHLVDYDTITGQAIKKQTHQGLRDDSSWARGQAWGLYGYTLCYRETKDQKYLDAAVKIADYILSNLPEDRISYWDYNDPKIPNTYRDASAAAVTASALYELSKYTNDKYFVQAEAIIKSLSSDKYLAAIGTNKGFLLKHSVGNYPANSEIDFPLNYADYYYLEALKRKRDY